MSAIADNLNKVRKTIAGAATACGRSPGDVTLLAVTKNFSVDVIAEAIAAGQHRFGENRVQEAEGKIPRLSSSGNLEWHLIGHLQTNKARTAAEIFDVVESVDSVKLASKLDQACVAAGKILPVFLQVKLESEDTKFGAEIDAAAAIVTAISRMKGLRLSGLMAIPPFSEDPEQSRRHFRRLRQLRDDLQNQTPGCLGSGELSMGMSHDYAVAVQEGATIVRVGSAIFGERQYD